VEVDPTGFSRTFGLVNPQFVSCTVPLAQRDADSPGHRYARAVEELLARDAHYQAAVVVTQTAQAS
jgi:hypothetical protein